MKIPRIALHSGASLPITASLRSSSLPLTFISSINTANSCHSLLSCTALHRPSTAILRLAAPSLLRHASHKAQGSVNSSRDGPGKRLGAKKSGGEPVLTSQIIFRQHGTHWHAGHNAGRGRDHTIYALTSGYVRYYKDPVRHPTRKYIGVVHRQEETLPVPPGAARRRRLEVVPMKRPAEDVAGDALTVEELDTRALEREKEMMAIAKAKGKGKWKELTLRPGGMYREGNWEIGRAKLFGKEVAKFDPRDRFTAWKKTVKRKLRNQEKKVGMGADKKVKK